MTLRAISLPLVVAKAATPAARKKRWGPRQHVEPILCSRRVACRSPAHVRLIV